MQHTLILVTAAAILLAAASAATGVLAVLCESTFHKTQMVTLVRNPPIQPVEILRFAEPAQHFKIDCMYIEHQFADTNNRACTNLAGQRLQLCTTPVGGSGAWSCQDISQYLSTEFSETTVGSRNGEDLIIRIMWITTTTDLECYPRKIVVLAVALPVPDPGTEPAASIVFVCIVGVIAVAVVLYGAYSLWRVTKKFEHRAEGDGDGDGMSPHGPQGAYRAALRALGAPEEFDSLYDEGGGGGDGDQQQHPGKKPAPYYIGEDGEEYYDGDGDDGDDYDEEDDAAGEHDDFVPGAGAGAQQHSAVLDDNTVVQSTKAPVPWFQRELQKQSIQRNTMTSTAPVATSRRSNNVNGSRVVAATGLNYSDDDDEDGMHQHHHHQHQRPPSHGYPNHAPPPPPPSASASSAAALGRGGGGRYR